VPFFQKLFILLLKQIFLILMKAIKFLFFLITIGFLNSCYQDKGDFLRIYGIELSADFAEVSLGKTIKFTVKTDYGLDVTKQSKIFVTDASLQETPTENGTSITSMTDKKFKVYAEYPNPNDVTKILRSKEITVLFDRNAQSFVKHVLIEDYTGAWCVNCPAVSYAIEQLKLQTNKAVPVAIHRGNTTASFDPYHFEAATPLLQQLNVIAYPTAKLNRTLSWGFPQYSQANLTKALNLTTGEAVRLGVAMKSTVENNTINLDVKVKFFKDYDNLKLVVYVLENKLIYPQENGNTLFGPTPEIEDFEHDHVLRAVFTNILGDVIPTSETKDGNIYVRNFSVPIPTNIANTANMEFVAFVLNSNNTSINVRKTTPGENQIFEEN
jgi:hypothetical protein